MVFIRRLTKIVYFSQPGKPVTNAMQAIPVIAVFDIGKTNKKFFLFTEQYRIVFERSAGFDETVDEDGFPCEDIVLLRDWVLQTMNEALAMPGFTIEALNISAYGASFVPVDETGRNVTPLYNYLRPFPQALAAAFYTKYGGEQAMALATASPILGNLNSGMQLYRLKQERPDLFGRIHYALHLPQYISYLFTQQPCSDITSIGCHTGLWDFSIKDYHAWVDQESIRPILAPLTAGDKTAEANINGRLIKTGAGLHDSSAALIPYLSSFHEPFVLLSTGTWCISLNPFNDDPLTAGELAQDCLYYIRYDGRPVKAARLFAGREHEEQVKRLAEHFETAESHYREILFDHQLYAALEKKGSNPQTGTNPSAFGERELSSFSSYAHAYHQLIYDIMQQQALSTSLVLHNGKTKRIFVDGGFAKNPLYMNMLAMVFPAVEVFAASVSQASAMGAALAIHAQWNNGPLPGDIVELKYYKPMH
jgi:sugar (pentulose or hexulose) kinase